MLANLFSISHTTVKDIAINEGSRDRYYLIVMCILFLNPKDIPTYALVEYGATSYVFINQDFTNSYELPLHPQATPHTLCNG
jgi:hypothetical protein